MSNSNYTDASASERTALTATQLNPVSGRSLQVRSAAWLAYGLFALIYVGALLAPVQGLARFLTLEVIYTAPIALTVILGAMAARASAGVERGFWVFVSAANTTLVGCELLLVWWVLVISANGPPRVSWPFHFLHLVAAGCFLGLVLSMSRLQDDQAASRLRIGLDITALSVLAYVALLQLYARPVMGSAPVSAVLLGAAYPLTGFLLIFGTLALVVGFKFVKWRSWEMLVAVSLAVYALAISLWPVWYVTASDSSRNLTRGALDLVQLTGHYLLLMAAVYRLSQPTQGRLRPLPLPKAARNPWLGAVLPVGSLVAIVALLATSLSLPQGSDWAVAYGVIAVVLVSLMMGRSVLLTLEHSTLFHRSVTDPLTGLFNHRYFHDHLQDEVQRAQLYGDELSLVVIDVDDFGAYNSVHGHLSGDLLLSQLGGKLSETCGSTLVCTRLGGDEFAIIAPEMDLNSARLLAQRVLDVTGIECGDEPGSLSASAGVASFPEHAATANGLLRAADEALRQAKHTGKGRVVAFDPVDMTDLMGRPRIELLDSRSMTDAPGIS